MNFKNLANNFGAKLIFSGEFKVSERFSQISFAVNFNKLLLLGLKFEKSNENRPYFSRIWFGIFF